VVGSRKVSLADVSLPNKAKLVRMINSQNNERLFFADKVVLVEGPSDRLVFASLLEATAARIGDNSAIEVVDVGGKHNFDSYQSLLDGLQTPWVTIGDQDYLAQVGSPAVKVLFQTDKRRVAEAILNDKKSIDRSTLIDCLHQAIKYNDVGRIGPLLEYIEARHRRLKKKRYAEEDAALAADNVRLAREGVIILDGEIEDYLPEDVREIADIVEFVSERNWIRKVPHANKRKHLAEVACFVLGVKGNEKSALMDAAERGEKAFPDPIVTTL